ncbi:hypothetical protein [Yinghuangia sp. YIM S09857]|uniref:hypothetical protein n=1 Tax=Yinghuangia sp. YIM S09857 TaxID=3436929 RepID=UPI003F53C239
MASMPPDAGRPGHPRNPIDGEAPPRPRVSPEADTVPDTGTREERTSRSTGSAIRDVPKRAQETAAHTAHIAAEKAEHARDRAVAAGHRIGDHTPDAVKSAAGEAVSQTRRRPVPVVGAVVAGALVVLWVRRSRRS